MICLVALFYWVATMFFPVSIPSTIAFCTSLILWQMTCTEHNAYKFIRKIIELTENMIKEKIK